MPVSFSEHSVDPDDPDGAFRRLASPDSIAAAGALQDPSPWVEPDYSTVAKEHEIAGPGPHRNWPGPPLVMPAGLLPDGLPYSGDDMDNARRIEGTVSRNEVEADACVRAFERQQRLLRREAGIERGYRDATGRHDPPAAYEAIVELHRREREQRRRRAS
ncbi:hypothetical protein [Amycolatopsis sp. NBC_01480]|uniref:hypothetical protein n=1 Tax=Amycolatopsis sp. NBC_01480 TaxID=2903562 RepID=UPI002E2B6E27|nr:hypothetical protein [Amycolatopsis sp. NBC_01480]